MSGMARAVEQLGLRACLTESIMDSGEGLPASWDIRATDDCIQVDRILFALVQYMDHGCMLILYWLVISVHYIFSSIYIIF